MHHGPRILVPPYYGVPIGMRSPLVTAPPAYQAYGVNFANSPYITRGAALTGLTTNQSTLTVSVWFNVTGLDGTQQYIARTTGGKFEIFKWTDNQIYVQGKNTSGTNVFAASTSISGGFTTSTNTGWHHLIISFDITGGSPVGYAYLDGSTSNISVGTLTGTSIVNFATETNFAIGATTSGTLKIHSDIAEVYLTNTYTDISNPTNLAKWISGGHPVDLGVDGSTPTGTQPILYLKADGATPANFATNLGSGGTTSIITGSLTNSGTNP